MKQFFKILALAALALPFTGCDVEYDPIVVQPTWRSRIRA